MSSRNNDNNKEKLLVLTTTFPKRKGDSEPAFVFELCHRLAADFDVTVLTPHLPGALTYQEIDGVKVCRFRYFLERYEILFDGGALPQLKKYPFLHLLIPIFFLAQIMALRRTIRSFRPEIIHAHWIVPSGLTVALLARFYHIPYVVTSHGSDLMGFRGWWFIKNFILRRAQTITVVSSALKKEIPNLSVCASKIIVAPMGLDTKLFSPSMQTFANQSARIELSPSLLCVSRLVPAKGIGSLIETMQIVKKQFPSIRLSIIGRGSIEEELKLLVRNSDLEKNVEFLGYKPNDELPSFYRSADVFVCPSEREGFGLVVAEAMLSGCLVVATRVGGLTDLISDGQTGFFVPPNNPRALAERIIYVLTNVDSLGEVKRKAREHVCSNFDWKIVTEKYKEILQAGL